MQLQDQVIPLPMAQRLKELGVKQESLFWWTQEKTPSNPNLHYYGYSQDSMPWMICFGQKSIVSTYNVHEEYAAFTVAELGEMIKLIGIYSCVNTVLQGWAIHHVNGYREYGLPSDDMNNYDTEAEARCATLIHLLESNLITIEEVNSRI